MSTYSIYEFDSLAGASADQLNNCIPLCQSDHLCLIDSHATNPAEFTDILNSLTLPSDNELIILGKNIDDSSYAKLLMSYPWDIYGVVINTTLFHRLGCFNEKLSGSVLAEFLCRALTFCNYTIIPCEAATDNIPVQEADALTWAYILRKSINALSATDELNTCVEHYLQYFHKNSLGKIFMDAIGKLTADTAYYNELADNTAPFLIIIGDSTCYGALRHFGLALSDALKARGQAVITSEDITDEQIYLEGQFKAIIGFQSPALFNSIFRGKRCKKFQFWFDHPGFFPDMFKDITDDYIFLCQDANYAEYIKKNYNARNAIHFSPGGTPRPHCDCGKIYDISFVGSYMKPQLTSMTPEESIFYNYMLAHPSETFEEGLAHSGLKGTSLAKLRQVCLAVAGYYKNLVVKTILDSGFTLHVCGDTWYQYGPTIPDNLVIHPAMDYSEASDFWAQSRISLNIMTWHKAGMTERIAEIMMAGSVCLSDSTSYLETNFEKDEIVLFSLSELEKLPIIISELLQNKELQHTISEKGRKKAERFHSWSQKAAEICNFLK